MQQLSSVEGSAPTCTLLPLSSTLLPSTPYGTTAMRFIVVEKEDQMSDVIINPQKISTVVRSDEKAMFCTSFGSNFDLHIVLSKQTMASGMHEAFLFIKPHAAESEAAQVTCRMISLRVGSLTARCWQ